jgi:hypothetical protein
MVEKEVVARKSDALSGAVDSLDGDDLVAVHVDAVDLDAEVNLAAGLRTKSAACSQSWPGPNLG